MINSSIKYAHSFIQVVSGLIYRLFSRISRYLLTALLFNTAIWSTALVTIAALPERYESQWTLILPGAGIGGRVDIDSIGSASAIVESGFSSRNLSPKVNYKSIAQSSQVLKAAAMQLDMNINEFGKPKIKLVDQTSLIFFAMQSDQPKIAQQKSWALYRALQNEIDHLRMDEISHREQGIKNMLNAFGDKLNLAKNRLLEHQTKSDIVTIKQFNQIPLLIEEMRIDLLKLNTQKGLAYEEMMTLHRILGLTSKQAAQLLSLQADPLFNELLKNQAESSAELAKHQNQLGQEHPKIKQQRLNYQANTQAIAARVETLIGKQSWVMRTALSENSDRNALMHDLINKKIRYEGIKQQIIQLENQIDGYSNRLKQQTKHVSRLDELEREHQIAEAVFTSAVAKIDTGKSDIFASYPMLQLFMEPTLPQEISGAKPLHVYLGGVVGSLMSCVILIILWIRRKQQARGRHV